VLTVVGDYADLVLKDSPLVYYRFSETSGSTAVNQGSLGAAANGTYHSSGITLGAPSAFETLGSAARFHNAPGGFVSVPDLQVGPMEEVTIEMWIERNSDLSGLTSIYSADLWAPQALHMSLVSTSIGQDLQAGVNGGLPYVRFYPPWRKNQWYHLALTYKVQDGVAHAGFYLNGVLFGGTTAGGAMINFAGGRIGAYEASRYLDGSIDEFAIYPAILTPEQIAARFESGAIVSTPPVLGVSRSGSQIVLSWSASGYKLQENADLTNAQGWIDVPNGGSSPVTLSIGAGQKFYRLQK
jgi:hypothetical protein